MQKRINQSLMKMQVVEADDQGTPSYYVEGYVSTKVPADQLAESSRIDWVVLAGDQVYDLSRFSQNPVCVIDHDLWSCEAVIGAWVELREDAVGLWARCKLRDDLTNPEAVDIVNGIRNGYIRATSIQFDAKYDHPDYDWVCTGALIYEISFCPVPANPTTLTTTPIPQAIAKQADDLPNEVLPGDSPVDDLEAAGGGEGVLDMVEVSAPTLDEAAVGQMVSQAVDDKLKSIRVQGGESIFAASKKTDGVRFDPVSKQFVPDVWSVEDAMVNAMLLGIHSKDTASVQSIQREIRTANARRAQAYHDAIPESIRQATPSVGDVSARGGYAIPVGYADSVLSGIYGAARVLKYADTSAMIFQDKAYPAFSNMTAAFFADEATGPAESNPTFETRTLTAYPLGAYAAVSNTLLRFGVNIAAAFRVNGVNAIARKIDLSAMIGNITGSSEPMDGLVFETTTYATQETAVAAAALAESNLDDMWVSLSNDAQNPVFFTGKKGFSLIKRLNDDAGNRLYPGLKAGDAISTGLPLEVIPQITGTLDVAGDNRSGTSTAIVLVDTSAWTVALDAAVNFSISEHALFTADQTAFKFVTYLAHGINRSNAIGEFCRILEVTA